VIVRQPQKVVEGKVADKGILKCFLKSPAGGLIFAGAALECGVEAIEGAALLFGYIIERRAGARLGLFVGRPIRRVPRKIVVVIGHLAAPLLSQP
jgi:hypothetical protein